MLALGCASALDPRGWPLNDGEARGRARCASCAALGAYVATLATLFLVADFARQRRVQYSAAQGMVVLLAPALAALYCRRDHEGQWRWAAFRPRSAFFPDLGPRNTAASAAYLGALVALSVVGDNAMTARGKALAIGGVVAVAPARGQRTCGTPAGAEPAAGRRGTRRSARRPSAGQMSHPRPHQSAPARPVFTGGNEEPPGSAAARQPRHPTASAQLAPPQPEAAEPADVVGTTGVVAAVAWSSRYRCRLEG